MPEVETITEERTEFTVSPIGDSIPTSRPAHFLKPSITSLDGPVSKIPPSCSLPSTFDPKKWPLAVQFNGWRRPPRKWIQWVHSLRPIHESTWKKVGIYDAIMSSKCHILRNAALVLGVAEKWCSETNTFVYPWGEATITLEDMMVLGGYPVLGASVLSPLESKEFKEAEKKLLLARTEAGRSKDRKSSITAWLNLFINSGSEIEHEAFLVAWLSSFVFPNNCLVRKAVFPIAVHLARGNPIALAPAVLASIYEDLRLLKQAISALPNYIHSLDNDAYLKLVLRSPLYLVQIWVWERIEALRPNPNVTEYGDPLLAKWEEVRSLKVKNVRLAINSAGEGFLWRPYAILAGKEHFPLFYPENEMWLSLDAVNLDMELKSFIMCLRVSELVGLDCINQYLPHRVAMQFGMDQDLPGRVPRLNETSEIAWENYSRPITCRRLYIPSRLFEADATTRYAEWWKQSVLSHQDSVQGKWSQRPLKYVPPASKANRSDNDADIPLAFPSKCSNDVILGNSCRSRAKMNDVSPKRFKTLSSIYFSEECSKVKSDNPADVPPGFTPKLNIKSSANSAKECEPAILKQVYSVEQCSKTKPGNAVNVPPGFPPKHNLMNSAKSAKECEPTVWKEVYSLEEGSKDAADNCVDVPPGFPSKHNTVSYGNFLKECKPKILKKVHSVEEISIAKANHIASFPPGFPPKHNTMSFGNSVKECEPTILKEPNSVEEGSMTKGYDNADVPPGFPPKHNIMSYGKSVMECEPTILKENRGVASKGETETSMESLHQEMNDANKNKESYLIHDRTYLSPTEGKERISRLERKSYTSEVDIEQLEERISNLEKLYASFKC